MEASDIRRLNELEEENSKLKRMFAYLSLENEALKEVIAKNALGPAEKRDLVDHMGQEHGLSVRQSCAALRLSRTVYGYRPALWDDLLVIEALLQLAERYPRYGSGKLFAVVRRHGYRWNHKRVYRVYCLLKLNLRRKGKKRLPSRNSPPRGPNKWVHFFPPEANVCWSLDFCTTRS